MMSSVALPCTSADDQMSHANKMGDDLNSAGARGEKLSHSILHGPPPSHLIGCKSCDVLSPEEIGNDDDLGAPAESSGVKVVCQNSSGRLHDKCLEHESAIQQSSSEFVATMTSTSRLSAGEITAGKSITFGEVEKSSVQSNNHSSISSRASVTVPSVQTKPQLQVPSNDVNSELDLRMSVCETRHEYEDLTLISDTGQSVRKYNLPMSSEDIRSGISLGSCHVPLTAVKVNSRGPSKEADVSSGSMVSSMGLAKVSEGNDDLNNLADNSLLRSSEESSKGKSRVSAPEVEVSKTKYKISMDYISEFQKYVSENKDKVSRFLPRYGSRHSHQNLQKHENNEETIDSEAELITYDDESNKLRSKRKEMLETEFDQHNVVGQHCSTTLPIDNGPEKKTTVENNTSPAPNYFTKALGLVHVSDIEHPEIAFKRSDSAPALSSWGQMTDSSSLDQMYPSVISERKNSDSHTTESPQQNPVDMSVLEFSPPTSQGPKYVGKRGSFRGRASGRVKQRVTRQNGLSATPHHSQIDNPVTEADDTSAIQNDSNTVRGKQRGRGSRGRSSRSRGRGRGRGRGHSGLNGTPSTGIDAGGQLSDRVNSKLEQEIEIQTIRRQRGKRGRPAKGTRGRSTHRVQQRGDIHTLSHCKVSLPKAQPAFAHKLDLLEEEVRYSSSNYTPAVQNHASGLIAPIQNPLVSFIERHNPHNSTHLSMGRTQSDPVSYTQHSFSDKNSSTIKSLINGPPLLPIQSCSRPRGKAKTISTILLERDKQHASNVLDATLVSAPTLPGALSNNKPEVATSAIPIAGQNTTSVHLKTIPSDVPQDNTSQSSDSIEGMNIQTTQNVSSCPKGGTTRLAKTDLGPQNVLPKSNALADSSHGAKPRLREYLKNKPNLSKESPNSEHHAIIDLTKDRDESSISNQITQLPSGNTIPQVSVQSPNVASQSPSGHDVNRIPVPVCLLSSVASKTKNDVQSQTAPKVPISLPKNMFCASSTTSHIPTLGMTTSAQRILQKSASASAPTVLSLLKKPFNQTKVHTTHVDNGQPNSIPKQTEIGASTNQPVKAHQLPRKATLRLTHVMTPPPAHTQPFPSDIFIEPAPADASFCLYAEPLSNVPENDNAPLKAETESENAEVTKRTLACPSPDPNAEPANCNLENQAPAVPKSTKVPDIPVSSPTVSQNHAAPVPEPPRSEIPGSLRKRKSSQSSADSSSDISKCLVTNEKDMTKLSNHSDAPNTSQSVHQAQSKAMSMDLPASGDIISNPKPQNRCIPKVPVLAKPVHFAQKAQDYLAQERRFCAHVSTCPNAVVHQPCCQHLLELPPPAHTKVAVIKPLQQEAPLDLTAQSPQLEDTGLDLSLKLPDFIHSNGSDLSETSSYGETQDENDSSETLKSSDSASLGIGCTSKPKCEEDTKESTREVVSENSGMHLDQQKSFLEVSKFDIKPNDNPEETSIQRKSFSETLTSVNGSSSKGKKRKHRKRGRFTVVKAKQRPPRDPSIPKRKYTKRVVPIHEDVSSTTLLSGRPRRSTVSLGVYKRTCSCTACTNFVIPRRRRSKGSASSSSASSTPVHHLEHVTPDILVSHDETTSSVKGDPTDGCIASPTLISDSKERITTKQSSYKMEQNTSKVNKGPEDMTLGMKMAADVRSEKPNRDTSALCEIGQGQHESIQYSLSKSKESLPNVGSDKIAETVEHNQTEDKLVHTNDVQSVKFTQSSCDKVEGQLQCQQFQNDINNSLVADASSDGALQVTLTENEPIPKKQNMPHDHREKLTHSQNVSSSLSNEIPNKCNVSITDETHEKSDHDTNASIKFYPISAGVDNNEGNSRDMHDVYNSRSNQTVAVNTAASAGQKDEISNWSRSKADSQIEQAQKRHLAVLNRDKYQFNTKAAKQSQNIQNPASDSDSDLPPFSAYLSKAKLDASKSKSITATEITFQNSPTQENEDLVDMKKEDRHADSTSTPNVSIDLTNQAESAKSDNGVIKEVDINMEKSVPTLQSQSPEKIIMSKTLENTEKVDTVRNFQEKKGGKKEAPQKRKIKASVQLGLTDTSKKLKLSSKNTEHCQKSNEKEKPLPSIVKESEKTKQLEEPPLKQQVKTNEVTGDSIDKEKQADPNNVLTEWASDFNVSTATVEPIQPQHKVGKIKGKNKKSSSSERKEYNSEKMVLADKAENSRPSSNTEKVMPHKEMPGKGLKRVKQHRRPASLDISEAEKHKSAVYSMFTVVTRLEDFPALQGPNTNQMEEEQPAKQVEQTNSELSTNTSVSTQCKKKGGQTDEENKLLTSTAELSKEKEKPVMRTDYTGSDQLEDLSEQPQIITNTMVTAEGLKKLKPKKRISLSEKGSKNRPKPAECSKDVHADQQGDPAEEDHPMTEKDNVPNTVSKRKNEGYLSHDINLPGKSGDTMELTQEVAKVHMLKYNHLIKPCSVELEKLDILQLKKQNHKKSGPKSRKRKQAENNQSEIHKTKCLNSGEKDQTQCLQNKPSDEPLSCKAVPKKHRHSNSKTQNVTATAMKDTVGKKSEVTGSKKIKRTVKKVIRKKKISSSKCSNFVQLRSLLTNEQPIDLQGPPHFGAEKNSQAESLQNETRKASTNSDHEEIDLAKPQSIGKEETEKQVSSMNEQKQALSQLEESSEKNQNVASSDSAGVDSERCDQTEVEYFDKPPSGDTTSKKEELCCSDPDNEVETVDNVIVEDSNTMEIETVEKLVLTYPKIESDKESHCIDLPCETPSGDTTSKKEELCCSDPDNEAETVGNVNVEDSNTMEIETVEKLVLTYPKIESDKESHCIDLPCETPSGDTTSKKEELCCSDPDNEAATVGNVNVEDSNTMEIETVENLVLTYPKIESDKESHCIDLPCETPSGDTTSKKEELCCSDPDNEAETLDNVNVEDSNTMEIETVEKHVLTYPKIESDKESHCINLPCETPSGDTTSKKEELCCTDPDNEAETIDNVNVEDSNTMEIETVEKLVLTYPIIESDKESDCIDLPCETPSGDSTSKKEELCCSDPDNEAETVDNVIVEDSNTMEIETVEKHVLTNPIIESDKESYCIDLPCEKPPSTPGSFSDDNIGVLFLPDASFSSGEDCSSDIDMFEDPEPFKTGEERQSLQTFESSTSSEKELKVSNPIADILQDEDGKNRKNMEEAKTESEILPAADNQIHGDVCETCDQAEEDKREKTFNGDLVLPNKLKACYVGLTKIDETIINPADKEVMTYGARAGKSNPGCSFNRKTLQGTETLKSTTTSDEVLDEGCSKSNPTIYPQSQKGLDADLDVAVHCHTLREGKIFKSTKAIDGISDIESKKSSDIANGQGDSNRKETSLDSTVNWHLLRKGETFKLTHSSDRVKDTGSKKSSNLVKGYLNLEGLGSTLDSFANWHTLREAKFLKSIKQSDRPIDRECTSPSDTDQCFESPPKMNLDSSVNWHSLNKPRPSKSIKIADKASDTVRSKASNSANIQGSILEILHKEVLEKCSLVQTEEKAQQGAIAVQPPEPVTHDDSEMPPLTPKSNKEKGNIDKQSPLWGYLGEVGTRIRNMKKPLKEN